MSTHENAKTAQGGGDSAGRPVRRMNPLSRFFDHFAAHITKWAGSPMAFGAALSAVLIWAACGPAFGFSETWQLVINTGTTIVTFLMVFVIQQTQNKDGQALHLKLDELLITLKGADEALVDAELLDEDKLRALAAACTVRARKLAHDARRGGRLSDRDGAARPIPAKRSQARRRPLRAGKLMKNTPSR